MKTEPELRPPPPVEPRQRTTRIAGFVIGGLLAVGLVVALAIVGTSNHHRAVSGPARPPTPTTAPDPHPRAGAPSRAITYVNTTVPVTYGGMTRSYLLLRPKSTSAKKLPVIMVLHGRDVTPAFEEVRTNFTAVVGPSILVYPTGYRESWNAGGCCGPAMTANVDDVGFLRTVLHRVEQQPDASRAPAYVAGYSNGGKMALRMACQDPEDLAAVAVFGATDAQPCPDRPPSPVLVMGATLDTQIPPTTTPPAPETNGYVPPSFSAEIDAYRQADTCAPQPVVTRVGSVTLTSWVHCATDQRVGQAIFTGADHDWPAGTVANPSGAGVAWAWFSALGA